MIIERQLLLDINQNFGGDQLNMSSLDFAIDMQNNKRISKWKKLAYLIRAILIDHPFNDGNKRTAMFVIFKFADDNNLSIISYEAVITALLSITKHNINRTELIVRRLKNVIR